MRRAHARKVPHPFARKAQGLALITVLWLISLLTFLATAMLAISRNHGRISARAAQSIAAESIADSAIRLTLLRIGAPLREGQSLGFSAGWRMVVLDRPVDIRLEREAGRVDLNATGAPLLAAVLIAGGLQPQPAHTLASRIIDWRDADDELQPGGAEAAEYNRANLSYAPRNAPFQSIGELRHVLGAADLSLKILDAFTVYSTRSPTIARDFAHPLVAKAMSSIADMSGAALGPQLLAGQVVRIHACVKQDAITLCRSVIARLIGHDQRPFLIYDWHSDAAPN
jgi:general secretion pathway protein K